MEPEKAIERYLQALLNPDRRIQKKAIVGLVEAGGLKAIPHLEKVAAEHGDAELRFLAKTGLVAIKASLEFRGLVSAAPAEADRGKPAANLDALGEHLRNPSPDMRARVVKAAVATKDPRILDVLVRHAEGETEPQVRGLVLLAVGILGDKNHLPLLAAGLKNPDPILRRSAVDGLGSMNKPFAYPYLVEALLDRDEAVRNAAFAILRRLGKVNILKLLDSMVASKTRWMQLCALRACSRFNGDEVVALLQRQVPQDDAELQGLARQALGTLARAGNLRARDSLGAEAPAPPAASPAVAPAAVAAEAAAPAEATAPAEAPRPMDLGAAAHDLASGDARKRLRFLQDAILHEDRRVIPDIIKRLPSEPDAKVRASMLITLGRLGGAEELPLLTPLLEDPEDRMRASAVEAIAHVAGADLRGLLAPRLQDKDNRTRANAIVALKDCPGLDLVTPLRELAESVRIRDRLSAIYAVTHVATPAALEILEGLLADPSRVVAKRAGEAQLILTGKPRPTDAPEPAKPAAPAARKPAAAAPPAEPPAKPAAKPTAEPAAEAPPAEAPARQPKAPERQPRKPERPDTKRDHTGRHEEIERPARGGGAVAKIEAAPKGKREDAKGGIPRGIMLHASVDLAMALGLGGLGLFFIVSEGTPEDEALLPFCIIFILTPGVFLAGGLGLLMGRSWGRHVNGCLLHVLAVPVLAPLCLSYLVLRESLEYLGMDKADFPAKLYYAVAGVAVAAVVGALVLAGA